MSKVEEESVSDEDSSSLKKYSLDEIKEMEIEKVYDHIQALYKIIRAKSKKYKRKFKKLEKKCKDLEEQQQKPGEKSCNGEAAGGSADSKRQSSSKAEEQMNVNEMKENEADTVDGMTASTAFDFVNEMRHVAQHALDMNDFVYEPTSGLYYDQKSGYYYNAEYGLYYDGNTGCYYSYNAQTNSFEFHSQVQVQANSAGLKDDEDVEFDEFGGVITDPDKLQQIKKDKELKKLKDKDKYKKTKKKDDRKDHNDEESLAKKKRKRLKDSANGGCGGSQSPTTDSDDEQKKKLKQAADVEEGELSDSTSTSDDDSESDYSKDHIIEFKRNSRFQDIAKKYPPSLRIIVQETNLDHLKVGNLSIITYKGGSLGREADNDVVIPDVNVSKCHLKFSYDHKKSSYQCVDLGSRNGTILNGVRMSVSQAESEIFELVHGSVIQIGQTKILCHVHEGNSTCGLCEPGLLIEQEKPNKSNKNEVVALSHKEQLKKLQKKYGLEHEKFVDGNKGGNTNGSYNDRAATRRTAVGSSSDKEKTQVATVDTEISSENKGFKMLSKLGWSKGEGLGKTTGALLEPINVMSNEGTKGLGCDEPSVSLTFTKADRRKLEALKKTQERYQKAADIFLDDNSN